MVDWQWLFLLEGITTVIVAAVCKFILLVYPCISRRVSVEERQLADIRIMHDEEVTLAQPRFRLRLLQTFNTAMVDLRTYNFMAIYRLDNGCATVSYFILLC